MKLQLTNSLLLLSFCMPHSSLGVPRQYPVDQLFVLDVAGYFYNSSLPEEVGPLASAVALDAFGSVFGPYNLISPGTNVTNRRRLFSTCPSSCTGANRQLCTALHCLTRGTKRRLSGSYSEGSTFVFDVDAAQRAVNDALGNLTLQYNAPMNSKVATEQIYSTFVSTQYVNRNVACQCIPCVVEPICAFQVNTTMTYTVKEKGCEALKEFELQREDYFLTNQNVKQVGTWKTKGYDPSLAVEANTTLSVSVQWDKDGFCEVWLTKLNASGIPVSTDVCSSCAICSDHSNDPRYPGFTIDCTNLPYGRKLPCAPLTPLIYPLTVGYTAFS